MAIWLAFLTQVLEGRTAAYKQVDQHTTGLCQSSTTSHGRSLLVGTCVYKYKHATK